MMKTFPDIPGYENNQKLTFSNTSKENIPVRASDLLQLIDSIEENEKTVFTHIELVYVDEKKITEINREYLVHDYVTDIITFRYDEDSSNQNIEGTLFCCAPRIYEQSEDFGSEPKTEFLRIFIHGLLHLCGYNDQSKEEKKLMTALENQYLEQLNPDS